MPSSTRHVDVNTELSANVNGAARRTVVMMYSESAFDKLPTKNVVSLGLASSVYWWFRGP